MDNPYQLLCDLARQEFRDEVDRLSRVEGKSFGLLSTLTLVIGIYGTALGWLAQNAAAPTGALDWLILLLSIIVLLGLACSWLYLFRAVTIDKRAFISVDDTLIEFYEDNSLVTINYYMANQFREAAEQNRSVTHRKVMNLTRGYWAIIISGVFTVILLALVGISIWNGRVNQTATSSDRVEVYSNG